MDSITPCRHRVSVVIYDFEPRGVQRTQIRLANEFVSLGYSVDALVFSTSGPLATSLSSGVRVIYLKAGSAKSAFFHLVKYLNAERPHYVFSAEDHVNVMLLLARFLSPRSIKYSVSCHVSPALWAGKARAFSKPWIVKKLVYALYPLAQQSVALSSGMVEEYQELIGVPKGLMRVIYNPVLSVKSVGEEDSNAIHPWLADSSLAVVLGVGNLSCIKRFDDLIYAFSKLRDQAAVRLIIVGNGPENKKLVDLIKLLGLSDRVDLVGYQPNPEAYMRYADVFVLSSRSEGLPTVLIEAIGSGCPVVSTKCGGGALEIMENGRLGPLVDIRDVNGLAHAIQSVLDSPPDREMLRKSAQRFRADAVAQKYLEGLAS